MGFVFLAKCSNQSIPTGSIYQLIPFISRKYHQICEGGTKDPPTFIQQVTVIRAPRSAAATAPTCRFPFKRTTCGMLLCAVQMTVFSTLKTRSASKLFSHIEPLIS